MNNKVIVIAQQKGGSGKTTIAAHLAVGLARMGNFVNMIDTDPQGSLQTWWNTRVANNLNSTNMQCVSCPGMRLSSEISRISMNQNKDCYVIVDCPPHTDIDTKRAIRYADIVVIPLQQSPTDIWATKSIIELVRSENKNFIVVANRCHHTKMNADIDEISRMLGINVDSYIGNRTAFINSMFSGSTAIEQHAKSAASDEINVLVRKIITCNEVVHTNA